MPKPSQIFNWFAQNITDDPDDVKQSRWSIAQQKKAYQYGRAQLMRSFRRIEAAPDIEPTRRGERHRLNERFGKRRKRVPGPGAGAHVAGEDLARGFPVDQPPDQIEYAAIGGRRTLLDGKRQVRKAPHHDLAARAGRHSRKGGHAK